MIAAALDRDRDLRAADRSRTTRSRRTFRSRRARPGTTRSAPTSSAATSSAASSTARASRCRSRSCLSLSRPRSAAPSARSPATSAASSTASLMRFADLVFAFPPIILAMVVAAVLGRGLFNAALAIVVVAWPSYARVCARARAVGRRLGVRAVGAAARRVEPQRTLFRDVLPNVAGPIFVLATLDLANAILLLSGLSFLGLGAQPPTAEWGSMVAEGTQYFQYWWIGTFPGLAIFTVVLAFNFLGDSLRDVFDPRTVRRTRGGARERARGRGAARPAADAGGRGDRRRRRRLRGPAGRGVRDRGRERQRQDGLDARAARPAARRLRWSRARRGSADDDLLSLPRRRLRRRSRGRDIAMVFQDPYTSLHPMLSIGRQLTEHVRLPPRPRPTAAPSERAVELLDRRAHPGSATRRSAASRTSSRAGCASASRSRSRSRAGPGS